MIEREQRMAENERLMELERRQLQIMELQQKRPAPRERGTAAGPGPGPGPGYPSGSVPKRRPSTTTAAHKTHVETDRKSDESEQFYTPGSTGRIESERAKEHHKEKNKPPAKDRDGKGREPKSREPRAREPKERDKKEPKGQGDSSSPQSSTVCYISRISYLEAEMAKCKRQLVNFVQDNREVLTHRKLRYHYEKLQPQRVGDAGEMDPEDEDDDDEDDHDHAHDHDVLVQFEHHPDIMPGGGGDGGGDSGAQSYKTFLLEQSRQKQLQLKEFLARDESNDYEHPDLSNVYKVRSYHAFGGDPEALVGGHPHPKLDYIRLFQSSYATATERMPSPETLEEPRRINRELDDQKQRDRLDVHHQLGHCHRHHEHQQHHHHHHNPNPHTAHNAQNPRNPHQQHACHRHRATGGPTYEHMRLRPEDIQEAQFVEGYN